MFKNHDLLATIQYSRKLYEKSFLSITEKYQLTKIEIDVLLFLANNPEYTTAKDIVELRGLTKSHVSNAVEKLIKRGFLVREIDKLDRRYIHLKIQEKAEDIVNQAKEVQKAFLEGLYKGFSKEEKEAIEIFLYKVGENIREQLKKS